MIDRGKVDACFAGLRRLHTVADKLTSDGKLGVAALRNEELVKAAASVASFWRICYDEQVPEESLERGGEEWLQQLKHFVRYAAAGQLNTVCCSFI